MNEDPDTNSEVLRKSDEKKSNSGSPARSDLLSKDDGDGTNADVEQGIDSGKNGVNGIRFGSTPSDIGNYKELIKNITKDQSPLGEEVVNEENKSNSGAETDNTEKNIILSKNNLDLLLKQYQQLLKTADKNPLDDAASTANHDDSKTNNQEKIRRSVILDDPCDNCKISSKKCVMVPGLENCVRCETTAAKCDLLTRNNEQNKEDSNTVDTTNSPDTRRKNDLFENDKYLKKSKSMNTVASSLPKSYENLFTVPHSESMVNIPTSKDGRVDKNNAFTRNPHRRPLETNSSHAIFKQYAYQPNLVSQSSPNVSNIQYPRSSFYVGSTSVYDISLVNSIKLDKIDQVQLSNTFSLRKVAPNEQFLIRDDIDQHFQQIQEQEVDLVEQLVYPHGKILVSIFFKLVHPYIPILHESVFLEKYSRSYQELTAPLLASVYSLSLQWWDYHPSLIGFPKPDIVDQLNSIAYKTFFDLVDKPKLSLIQTGLLLLQTRSESSNNWVICSALVGLAEELGLGVDCEEWRLPQWEKGLRRRLAWAIWAQDKWTASLEGRQSHLLLGRNWMVKPLASSDLPLNSPVIQNLQVSNFEPYDSPISGGVLFNMSPTDEDFSNGLLTFKHYVSLSRILSEIMNTFYCQGTEQITDIEEILKLAKPLQLKLRSWYQNLPPSLSMSNFTKGKFNTNASLTLSYFVSELTLHRRIISSLNSNTAPDIINVCRTAAKSRLVAAIDFIYGLKDEHINSFWYSSCTGGLVLIATFAALLYVTAPNKKDSLVFRNHLRKYIWMLKLGSKSFDKEKNALDRIHLLLAQIPGLLTDSSPSQVIFNRFQSPGQFSPHKSPLEVSSVHDSNYSMPQSINSKEDTFDYIRQPLSTTNILEAQKSRTHSPSVDSMPSNTPINQYSIFARTTASATSLNNLPIYKKETQFHSNKNGQANSHSNSPKQHNYSSSSSRESSKGIEIPNKSNASNLNATDQNYAQRNQTESQ